jgi:hypothetical protein
VSHFLANFFTSEGMVPVDIVDFAAFAGWGVVGVMYWKSQLSLDGNVSDPVW